MATKINEVEQSRKSENNQQQEKEEGAISEQDFIKMYKNYNEEQNNFMKHMINLHNFIYMASTNHVDDKFGMLAIIFIYHGLELLRMWNERLRLNNVKIENEEKHLESILALQYCFTMILDAVDEQYRKQHKKPKSKNESIYQKERNDPFKLQIINASKCYEVLGMYLKDFKKPFQSISGHQLSQEEIKSCEKNYNDVIQHCDLKVSNLQSMLDSLKQYMEKIEKLKNKDQKQETNNKKS